MVYLTLALFPTAFCLIAHRLSSTGDAAKLAPINGAAKPRPSPPP